MAVITGDVIGSSQYQREQRRHLDKALRSALRSAFRQVERTHRAAIYAPLTFRVTAGDEFQCVLSDVRPAFDIVTLLRALVATSGIRPLIRFRAAIGIGEMSVRRRTDPYAADGPAFLLARQGLDEINAGRAPVRWTKLTAGEPASDRAADVVLTLLDGLAVRWTAPQWEAVRWTIAGLDRNRAGRKLGIAHQNVSKRLRAADWLRFETGAAFLAELLEECSHLHEGAHSSRTPEGVRK